MNRRNFIVRGLAGATALGAGVLARGAESVQPTTKPAEPNFAGRPHLDPATVNEFVGAGHGNLARVKEMLEQEPAAQRRLGGLVLAERELSLGDLETALGGASHMGNREIALYLLAHGARIDAFCAAMLGFRDGVLALLKVVPQTATTRGPHNYSLLYHAAISGDTEMAAGIKPFLPVESKDYNQALTSAARAGQLAMTRWLLENGVDDPNATDGLKKTALAYATSGSFSEIVDELRKHGAK